MDNISDDPNYTIFEDGSIFITLKEMKRILAISEDQDMDDLFIDPEKIRPMELYQVAHTLSENGDATASSVLKHISNATIGAIQMREQMLYVDGIKKGDITEAKLEVRLSNRDIRTGTEMYMFMLSGVFEERFSVLH